MVKKRKVVNCDGEEFESAVSATRYCRVDRSSIHYAITNGTKVNGWRWRYADKDFVEPKHRYKRTVVCGDGREFESIESASNEFKCTHQAIRHAIITNTKCKGYTWQYKEQRVFDQAQIDGEIWKPHPNLPIHVSDIGRVDHIRITYGNNNDGYKEVGVKYKNYRIHRLVAETFIPNPENLPIVDHIDGNKSNNKVSNLRWCTQKQNMNWYVLNKKEE